MRCGLAAVRVRGSPAGSTLTSSSAETISPRLQSALCHTTFQNFAVSTDSNIPALSVPFSSALVLPFDGLT